MTKRWLTVLVALLVLSTLAFGQNRQGRPIMQAFVEDSDLIAQGNVTSVGAAREKSDLTIGGNRRVLREADVTLRLSEVYKGRATAGTEATVVIRLDTLMRGVTRDQQFLVFLTSNLTGVMNAGDPSAKTPRYAVRYLTWGFDSSAAGLMEIVSGKTARIITGVKYEDMGPFLDKEVTQVAAEIRKAVESKDN